MRLVRPMRMMYASKQAVSTINHFHRRMADSWAFLGLVWLTMQCHKVDGRPPHVCTRRGQRATSQSQTLRSTTLTLPEPRGEKTIGKNKVKKTSRLFTDDGSQLLLTAATDVIRRPPSEPYFLMLIPGGSAPSPSIAVAKHALHSHLCFPKHVITCRRVLASRGAAWPVRRDPASTRVSCRIWIPTMVISGESLRIAGESFFLVTGRWTVVWYWLVRVVSGKGEKPVWRVALSAPKSCHKGGLTTTILEAALD